jgi:hypothetical protein
MTPAQYNEMMRQADVLEKDKQYREFHQLWEQFRIENPNTVGTFVEQHKSFAWLWSKLKEKNEEQRSC